LFQNPQAEKLVRVSTSVCAKPTGKVNTRGAGIKATSNDPIASSESAQEGTSQTTKKNQGIRGSKKNETIKKQLTNLKNQAPHNQWVW